MPALYDVDEFGGLLGVVKLQTPGISVQRRFPHGGAAIRHGHFRSSVDCSGCRRNRRNESSAIHINPPAPVCLTLSEHELQCNLADPRAASRGYLAESGARI